MNDFVLKPGVPNQFGLSGTKRNLVAPDRRMVSSMSPTIVEDPQGRLFCRYGSACPQSLQTAILLSPCLMPNAGIHFRFNFSRKGEDEGGLKIVVHLRIVVSVSALFYRSARCQHFRLYSRMSIFLP
jgi:hypothetical protein